MRLIVLFFPDFPKYLLFDNRDHFWYSESWVSPKIHSLIELSQWNRYRGSWNCLKMFPKYRHFTLWYQSSGRVPKWIFLSNGCHCSICQCSHLFIQGLSIFLTFQGCSTALNLQNFLLTLSLLFLSRLLKIQNQ